MRGVPPSESSSPRAVYRIAAALEWAQALEDGFYRGGALDARDGFVHLSSAAQIAETLRIYFAGLADLVLLTISPEGLHIIWEPSREGVLFPHLYAALPVASVVRVAALPLDQHGAHVLPDLTP